MDFSQFRWAYAISGGIGSGKSTVCKILSDLGYALIDADVIAHGILEEKSQEIIQAFGEEIVQDGKINRKALGKIVFASPSERKRLESLLHPAIYAQLFLQCQTLETKQEPYFLEIPLLFEHREELNFKHKVLVLSSLQQSQERIQQRDQLSLEEINLRFASQLRAEEKIPYATTLIYNLGSLQELKAQVHAWVSTLQKR